MAVQNTNKRGRYITVHHLRTLVLQKKSLMIKIGIIGCGNLGLSLLNGIRQKNPTIQIYASKRNVTQLKDHTSTTTFITSDNEELIKNSDVLIIALKPYTLIPFLKDYAHLIDESRHTLISCATGITIDEITSAVSKNVGVYRAMPNTAASVNESMTTLSSNMDPLNRSSEVIEILESLGTVIVIDETLMESATILGACGIAYVLRFMRAMIQGGIEVGFDAQTATRIVSQTMLGAAELIIQNGTHPEQEIDKVTTPKGCTIVGLNEMEHAGFSSALIKGIVASYAKIER